MIWQLGEGQFQISFHEPTTCTFVTIHLLISLPASQQSAFPLRNSPYFRSQCS